MNWDYQNLQFKTVEAPGNWHMISGEDLARLEKLQDSGWEVYHTVSITGSSGFTAHVIFMLRRESRR
jgi:hypothetical protein